MVLFRLAFSKSENAQTLGVQDSKCSQSEKDHLKRERPVLQGLQSPLFVRLLPGGHETAFRNQVERPPAR